METLDKVKQLIAEHLNKPVEEITEDKEIVKDLGADSLDIVEMLMALEDEFGVEIEMDPSLSTVEALVKKIEELQNA